jgi:dihydroorotate dehydrogenase (fumarate)
MDLSTTYLGFELPHPLMTGASPLSENLDMVKRLEDAGSAAIQMSSLFEEQIVREEISTTRSMNEPAESFAEALTYFPSPEEFVLGPDDYLEQIRKIKDAVNVPVIASLNGTTVGGWLRFAKLIQDAGADALELNVYYLGTQIDESAADIEKRSLDMVKEIKKELTIPLAVKLSPYYSSVAHFANELRQAGANSLVLFNRFYQPDIDVEELEVGSKLTLSDSTELLLRLRWLAILSGRLQIDLAVTGGVHTAMDALKSVMCGAHAVQLVSALLINGPECLKTIRDDLARWLEEHEYDSLRQSLGSMNLEKSPNPSAYERANYTHILRSWQGIENL